MSIKDWLRSYGVPVMRPEEEVVKTLAEVRANLNRHTDRRGREYEPDIVMSVKTGEYFYARYYRGLDGTREQREKPFPGRSAERIKAEAEDMRESGLVFVYDDDGFRTKRPMTDEELLDPQRYRGCVRMPEESKP